jgi:DNA-binding NarL/FixJ family response regulator
MQTAATDERTLRATTTAVVVDPGRRLDGSAAAVADWLGVDVVAEGAWYSAAPTLVERLRPDLLVLACDNPSLCAKLVGQVRAADPETRVLVVASSPRHAAAYRRVLDSDTLIVLAPPRRRPVDGMATMTPREREIATLLADGLSNREIAMKLWVTERTIKFHLSNVYKKLGVTSRADAVAALQRSAPPEAS